MRGTHRTESNSNKNVNALHLQLQYVAMRDAAHRAAQLRAKLALDRCYSQFLKMVRVPRGWPVSRLYVVT